MAGISDDFIRERACEEPGCVNWAEPGVIYCVTHLHGAPRPIPEEIANRKLELEKRKGKSTWKQDTIEAVMRGGAAPTRYQQTQ